MPDDKPTFDNVEHGDSFFDMMECIAAGLQGASPVFHMKTFVPESKVWVSTVSWNQKIGKDRCAETMVFKDVNGNFDQSNNTDIDFEDLGWEHDEAKLREAHERMVKKWRSEH